MRITSMSHDVFMLYANCVAVRGYGRTAICDLQRNDIHFVPNSLTDLFIDNRFLSIEAVLYNLDAEDVETFTSYLQFLEQQELGFFCTVTKAHHFPKLSMEWLYPGFITNCILDAEDKLWYFNDDLLQQLENIGCDYLQIRFYKQTSFQHLTDLLNLMKVSKVKAVEILIPKSDTADFYNSAIELVISFPQIQTLIIHSDLTSEVIYPANSGAGQVITSISKINDESHCGIVSPSYFAVNIPHFTESISFNTCLHRKVSIDKDGNIKNCPSMTASFGNVAESSLVEAIEKPNFKNHWDITKDQIGICKDCEFRHVCTDCRAYLKDPDDVYSKPLKCGYNPYTCEWEPWSNNPLKHVTISHYNI